MNAPYEKTEDNFESHFQVNFLSHFLLTNLLMARIKETAARKNDPCQIVNTSSHAQRGGRIDFDELEERYENHVSYLYLLPRIQKITFFSKCNKLIQRTKFKLLHLPILGKLFSFPVKSTVQPNATLTQSYAKWSTRERWKIDFRRRGLTFMRTRFTREKSRLISGYIWVY